MNLLVYRFFTILMLALVSVTLLTACGSPPLAKPESNLSMPQPEATNTPVANVTQEASEANSTPSPTEVPEKTEVGSTSETPVKTPEEETAILSVSPLPTPTTEKTLTSVPRPPPAAALPAPTVVSIAAQDVNTTDTLDSGLKIVYAEIDGPAGRTTIWMSNVSQLDKRKSLVEISDHKPGYGPGGRVSPDGSKLLYSFAPADLTESEAYEGKAEVWILDIEKGDQQRLPERIQGFVKWRPDSQSIIYSQNKYEDAGGVETKIYSMSIADLRKTLIFSVDSFAFTWMDFLDNQTLLYLEWKSEILTEVRGLNLVSGETTLLQTIDVPRPWSRYSLSPDKTTLLITQVDTNSAEKTYKLMSISLATGETETILTSPYREEVDSQPIYRLDARWLPDSQTVLVHFPPQDNRSSSFLGLVSVDRKTPPQPLLDNTSFLEKAAGYEALETFLIPGEWSPDKRWLTALQYPRTDRDVYLLEIDTPKLIQIPAANSSYWISMMGWIE